MREIEHGTLVDVSRGPVIWCDDGFRNDVFLNALEAEMGHLLNDDISIFFLDIFPVVVGMLIACRYENIDS